MLPAATHYTPAARQHDLRNLLHIISGRTRQLRDSITDPHQTALLDRISQAVQTTAGLFNDVHEEPEAIDATAADLVVSLVESGLPAAISIDFRRPPSLASSALSRTELYRIIANLTGNAATAIAATQSKPVIQVDMATANNHPISPDAGAPWQASTGVWHMSLGAPRSARSFTCVRCRDAGPGISPDILASIFEPHVSTRHAASNQGLGLTIVRDIVFARGGTISVATAPGRGTRFTILIPDQAAPTTAVDTLAPAHQRVRPTGEALGIDTAVRGADAVSRVLYRADHTPEGPLADLLRHWSATSSSSAPDLDGFAAQVPHAGNLTIVDAAYENPLAFRIMQHSQESSHSRGADYANLHLGQIPSRLHAEGLAADYQLVKSTVAPRFQVVTTQYDRKLRAYSRLILPLARAGSVNALAVLVQIHEATNL